MKYTYQLISSTYNTVTAETIQIWCYRASDSISDMTSTMFWFTGTEIELLDYIKNL